MAEPLEIEMTPELETFMQKRREFYLTNYPNMPQEERTDLYMEDMVKEHFRLKGETVEVSVGTEYE